MAERDAFFEVVVGQITQKARINVVLGKRCAYCPKPSFSSHSAICCIGSTGIGLAAGRILDPRRRNVIPMFRDCTSCLRQFARSAFDYFAKVVRQYGCSLPRSAWMLRTTVYARFRQQAALRNETKVLAANWADP
jgi:hypothetical protein